MWRIPGRCGNPSWPTWAACRICCSFRQADGGSSRPPTRSSGRRPTGASSCGMSMPYVDNKNAESLLEYRLTVSATCRVGSLSQLVPISNQVYQEPHTCPALRAHPTAPSFIAQSNAGYICIFSTRKPFRLNKTKVGTIACLPTKLYESLTPPRLVPACRTAAAL